MKTRFHRIMNIIAIMVMLGTLLFLVLYWKNIPDSVPGHFNAAGEADRWGSKMEVLICPVFMLMIYGIITLTERHPQVWNTGVTVTPENQHLVYRELMSMIVVMKLLLVCDFAFITVTTAFGANLPVWFLVVVMTMLFGSIVFFMIRIYRYK